MAKHQSVFIVSDIHYAGPAEQRRGATEFQAVRNPLLRTLVKAYRHFIWRRDPFGQNHLLDQFMTAAQNADFVIANGDYSCDTAFIGVSDSAARESAQLCLEQLHSRFGTKFHAVLGDHELGKMSLFGGRGGMRLASWRFAQEELELKPFWTLPVGEFVFLGVTSSLLALPVFEPDTLVDERPVWQQLRNEHLDAIRHALGNLQPEQRLVLFCHDPTALPFLWQDQQIQSRLTQLDATIVGHLHSRLFLWQSRILSGMPEIRFLGNSVQRMSGALQQARVWNHFRLHLCPALGGIQLLNDGGFYKLELPALPKEPIRLEFCRLPR